MCANLPCRAGEPRRKIGLVDTHEVRLLMLAGWDHCCPLVVVVVFGVHDTAEYYCCPYVNESIDLHKMSKSKRIRGGGNLYHRMETHGYKV